MSSAYEGVLQRLQMYRQKRKLNQKSMSQMMGVTQSHYSKLEQGKTIISAEELKNFDSHGCNMDYLLTGEEWEETVLNHYLDACQKEVKSDFLQLMVWTIEQGVNISGKEQEDGVDYTKEIRLLRYSAFEKKTDSRTIWYWMRKASDFTQDKMAQHLDVTTKRYREIEKGRLGFNAELLAVLYQNLGYPPSIVFYEDVHNISSLNKIWKKFDSELQEELELFLKAGLEICNRNQRQNQEQNQIQKQNQKQNQEE